MSSTGTRNIDVDASGNVYVAEFFAGRVQKFDRYGTYLVEFGTAGSGNGQLTHPYGVAVDGNGNVFVTEFSLNRVTKFDSNGNFLTIWGSLGSGNGQFNQPVDVALGL